MLTEKMYLSVIVQSVSKLEIDQLLPTMAPKDIVYKLCDELNLLQVIGSHYYTYFCNFLSKSIWDKPQF